MRLTPREPKIPEVGGFTEENDIFGYRPFADRLANLVQNIEEPLVITLDGPWGSGKSVFAKQWAGLLRERGGRVVYFDAFKNDHFEDAFLAIATSIYTISQQGLGDDKEVSQRFFDSAKKAAVALAPMVLRMAVRAGTAGIVNLRDLKDGGEAFQEAAQGLKGDVNNVLERIVSEKFDEANEERASLENFRETLSALALALSNDQVDSLPLVFIIDELDRCRPTFALSLIERIKHMFSVPGVCFVLVTHLSQLEHAVQGAYGASFDAHTYLEKFYHMRIVLPKVGDNRVNHRDTYILNLWKELDISFPNGAHGDLVRDDIQALASAHDLSLRRLERIITHVAIVCASVGKNTILIPTLVAGLCVMRLTHPDLYEKARIQELSWSQIKNFLTPEGEKGIQEESSLNWWKLATNGTLTQDEKDLLTHALYRYGYHPRWRLLTITTNYIDSFVGRIS